MREEVLLLEEVFAVGIPCTRDIPGGEPAGLACATESIRPLIAGRPRDRVATLVGVGSISEEGDRAAEALRQAVVIPVLLREALEGTVVPEGGQTTVILHTPAVHPARDAVLGVDFGAEVGIDDMVILEGRIVGSGGTEVIALHATCLRIVEAPSRKDRLRK